MIWKAHDLERMPNFFSSRFFLSPRCSDPNGWKVKTKQLKVTYRRLWMRQRVLRTSISSLDSFKNSQRMSGFVDCTVLPYNTNINSCKKFRLKMHIQKGTAIRSKCWQVDVLIGSDDGIARVNTNNAFVFTVFESTDMLLYLLHFFSTYGWHKYVIGARSGSRH